MAEQKAETTPRGSDKVATTLTDDERKAVLQSTATTPAQEAALASASRAKITEAQAKETEKKRSAHEKRLKSDLDDKSTEGDAIESFRHPDGYIADSDEMGLVNALRDVTPQRLEFVDANDRINKANRSDDPEKYLEEHPLTAPRIVSA